jgi:transcriptional antiterminator NusG
VNADNEINGEQQTPNDEGSSEGGDEHHAPEEVLATESAATEGAPAEPGSKKRMRWYVVQAYSGYENKVKASLEERIRQYSMEAQFGDILIPREQVTETRGTAKRVSSRTFYPGYIFVQMDLTDESWHLVKDTPKVSGFVGGRYPTAVPASQINLVAQQVAEGAAKPKPRVVFEQGDHVRVVEGAFANFTGTIEEVKPEKQKVRVLVSIFGRATPVELDYGQVEKTV